MKYQVMLFCGIQHRCNRMKLGVGANGVEDGDGQGDECLWLTGKAHCF